MNQPINFLSKLNSFSEHWSPKVIAEMNDYPFKLVKIKGEFTWHNHADTDETFIVLEGSMGIEFRDRTVQLSEGEMIVVPRGEEHKPFANEECKVLLVEPKGVGNTGAAGGELTADNDVGVSGWATELYPIYYWPADGNPDKLARPTLKPCHLNSESI